MKDKKKNIDKYFIKDFLFGGCLGVTITVVSYLFASFLNDGFTASLKEGIIAFFAIFIWMGLCIGITFSIIRKKSTKPLNIEKKIEFLKKQSIIITILIIIVFIIFLVCYFKNFKAGALIMLLMIFALLLWMIGCNCGRKMLIIRLKNKVNIKEEIEENNK